MMMSSEDFIDNRDRLAKERTLLAGERTLLALERTFLSWMRTGLANVGGGFAIARLLTFDNIYHQLAAHIVARILILLGVSIFLTAWFSYHQRSVKVEHATGLQRQFWLTFCLSGVLISCSLVILVIA